MIFEAVMQNIKISYEILLVMSFKMSLNFTEMSHINNIINKINDPILFQVIPKA